MWEKENERLQYCNRTSTKSMLASEYEHRYIILYKYISLLALKTFADKGYMKVAFPNDSNDPFEMSVNGELPSNSRSCSNYGFLPMTRKRDNAVMWGNYADKYAGARLRLAIPFFSGPLKVDWELGHYDEVYTGLFAEETRKSMDVYFYDVTQDNSVEKSVEKCIYTDIRPVYKLPSVSSCPFNATDEQREEHVQKCFSYIVSSCRAVNIPLRTKPPEWSYEDEYRAFVASKDVKEVSIGEKLLFFTDVITPYVTSITLGPLCPISIPEIKILVKLCKSEKLNKDIIIKKAGFMPDRYSLDIPFEELDETSDFERDVPYEVKLRDDNAEIMPVSDEDLRNAEMNY